MHERFMLTLVEMGSANHPLVSDMRHIGALVTLWESMDWNIDKEREPSLERVQMWRDDLRTIYDWMMEHRKRAVQVLRDQLNEEGVAQ
jgi:hypothetical protein